LISTSLSRGDIALTRFRVTDLTDASLRPALVVSPGQIGQDIVLVGISSVVREALAPTDYTVDVTPPRLSSDGSAHDFSVKTAQISNGRAFNNRPSFGAGWSTVASCGGQSSCVWWWGCDMKRRKFLPVFGLHVCEKQSSSAMLCNTTVSAAARLTRTAV
jgi:mRNA-degrading endonuclease toxin of MazEF toxin-antitoxin module